MHKKNEGLDPKTVLIIVLTIALMVSIFYFVRHGEEFAIPNPPGDCFKMQRENYDLGYAKGYDAAINEIKEVGNNGNNTCSREEELVQTASR